MKKLILILMVALPLVVALGCGGDDDDGNTPPPPPTDEAVLTAGWTAFEGDDLAEAETQFRELLGRGKLTAQAHDGLGWTFARQSAADSALAHHQQALTLRGDTLSIADQMYAGLAFALDAAGDHAECLDAAGEVAAGWVFAHDDSIDHDDIVLLQAVAHYLLGQFEQSLAFVQQLDAGFTADVDTVEGRAALAARIEALAS